MNFISSAALSAALTATLALTSFAAIAADYPAPKQGSWIAKDFKFHTGATMPELRLGYTTVGEPTRGSRCWCCTAPAARRRAC